MGSTRESSWPIWRLAPCFEICGFSSGGTRIEGKGLALTDTVPLTTAVRSGAFGEKAGVDESARDGSGSAGGLVLGGNTTAWIANFESAGAALFFCMSDGFCAGTFTGAGIFFTTGPGALDEVVAGG